MEIADDSGTVSLDEIGELDVAAVDVVAPFRSSLAAGIPVLLWLCWELVDAGGVAGASLDGRQGSEIAVI